MSILFLTNPSRCTLMCSLVVACLGFAFAPNSASALQAAGTQAGICSLDIIFSEGFDVSGSLDLTLPGPFAVSSISGSSTQNSRLTPWVAHYPLGASSAAVVLFAPGFHLNSSLYQGWAAHLASWGYIAVRADPPSSFSPDEPSMALDLRNVISDVVKPAALPVTVDASRIALSGHGEGGKIAIMAAAGDARVRAVFTFDPVNEGGPSGYTAGQPSIVPQPVGSIAVPTGILGELVDSSGGFQSCTPAAINYQTIFSAAATAPVAYEWTLAGASYTSFVPDQASCGFSCSFCNPATLPPSDTYAFMRSSAVAFLQTHLQGTPRLCPWLSGKQLPAFISLRESTSP